MKSNAIITVMTALAFCAPAMSEERTTPNIVLIFIDDLGYGDQPNFLPLAHGFDEYFGIPYSNDMWPGNLKGHRHTKQPYTPLPVLHQDEVVCYVSDGADRVHAARDSGRCAHAWLSCQRVRFLAVQGAVCCTQQTACSRRDDYVRNR